MTATQARWDELAALECSNGYPTEEAHTRLLGKHYFQCAVQVYLGALPAVNTLALHETGFTDTETHRERQLPCAWY
jgi:hypothetical protein